MTDPEIPTPPGEMLRRTERRARQIRRRRRSVLMGAAAAVVAAAVAVPLALSGNTTRLDVVSGSSTTPSSTASPSPTTAVPVPGTTLRVPPPTTVPVPATTVPVPGTTGVPPTTSVLPKSSTPPTTAKATSMCSTSQLSGRLTGQNGTAGGVASVLVLTNKGSSACTLYGYPGVSYVTAGGSIVGAPAVRSPRTVQTVTVAPGAAAQAPLLEVDPYNYPPAACQLTGFASLRIYPPGQRASLVIPHAGKTCANAADKMLQVGPVAAG